jgi:hypothetical protein
VQLREPAKPEHHRALPQPANDEALFAPDAFDGEGQDEGDGDDLDERQVNYWQV